MPVVVHRSDRPEALADGLAAMLRDEPGDVFEPAWVVVPAQGVQRWLTQRLSHVLGAEGGEAGVAAGLELVSPASLVGLLLGRERDDPWLPDRLAWPTLAAVDECVGTPGFEALTRHLGGGPAEARRDLEWLRVARQSRRYAVARRLAGLFASYARERPGMLADWEAGGVGDGSGEPLDADLSWQPELWRRVLLEVESRTGVGESPSARHDRVVRDLRDGSSGLDLPGRLSLFGHTRLPTAEIELLAALGATREVHLWLPHPSPALWDALAAHSPASTDSTGRTRPRSDDDSATLARHPLLATLGRDVRELEQGLLAAGVEATAPPAPDDGPGDGRPTRLGLLQSDIRANRAPDPGRPLAEDDLSVQVHSCHGRSRQVEVLREVLAQLFQDDPTLEPRDVLVLTPDVEEFAPLVRAAFGSGVAGPPRDTPRHPGHELRVQLADRRLAATNPLVELAQVVLGLVAGRVTASEVLGLAAHEAVARRFRLDEDDLATLGHWVAESGARWGLDATHRGEYGLREVADNTWAGALDRLALGVAVAADSPSSAAQEAPIDDIGSSDIGLVGRFLELLDRVRAAADDVRRPAQDGGPRGRLTAREWTDWLHRTVTALGEVPREDRWQLAQFEAELATIADGGERLPLRINDVAVLLGHRWGARPSRANFRTGAITVCTMVPMRSIPHRVVAVLGVDDGAFPRNPVVDGDDVLARRPLVGQRDPRSEDRQLLLDALMSATDHFVAIYSGHDEHTGARRPPAVPLQELVSAAERTGRVPGDPADAEGLVRVHPLQAFDARNFGPRPPVVGGSFDRAALAGAEALRAHRASGLTTRPLLVPEPLAEVEVTAVTLDELTRFFENPAREFSRQRLGIGIPREEDEPSDHVPIALDALEAWQIGDRVLRHVLDGGDPDASLDREQRSGTLPPTALGGRLRQDIAQTVAGIAQGVVVGARRSVDVRADLPSGIRLTGVVGGVEEHRLTLTTYSTVSAKHEIVAWVRLLALVVAEPGDRWVAELTGRKGTVHLAAPPAGEARVILDGLVDVRTRGLRFPLGIPPRTARAYAMQAAARRLAGGAAVGDARGGVGVGRPLPRARRPVVDLAARRGRTTGAARPPGDAALLGAARVGAGPPRQGAALVTGALPAFDVCGPLPTGTTLVEASAGTGKTWTLAALVTRYVADEGLPLEELLVVTFSRLASQELRERVRRQLEATVERLERPADPDDDELVRHLRRGTNAEVGRRIRRIRAALADFDTATIATIHQFCHLVLRGLGVAGDSDPHATLVEDLTELRRDVVDDLFLARAARGGRGADHATSSSDARVALDNPRAPLLPAAASPPVTARQDFMREVRVEFARRKRRGAVLGYDDLLGELADALEDPDGPARVRMRQRWSVVLVDEFQDTDPVQWEVFSRAFATAGTTLVLIGDPKQAIYGFRGGDVHTYLSAARGARTFGLPTNHRSDAPLVDALQVLTCGAQLSSGIEVHPIRATLRAHRLTGGPDGSPVRMRVIGGDRLPMEQARTLVAADAAAQVVELLDAGAEFDGRPLVARDIAVLARTNKDLHAVRAALRERAVPSVLVTNESVLRTEAATWWLVLLTALEQPHRPERVRAACLTPLIGWSVQDLDGLGEDATDRAAERVRELVTAFHRGGMPGVLDVLRGDGLGARILGRVGGERDLTDVEHCAQVLQEQVGAGRPSLDGAGHLAPAAVRRGCRCGLGDAGHPARLRRARGDPVHDPRRQGPAVPRRPRTLPLQQLGPDRGPRPRPPRRRAGHRLRRGARSQGRGPGGGRGRGPAPRLRRDDARAVPPRPLVGADLQHPGQRAPPAALRTRPRRRRARGIPRRPARGPRGGGTGPAGQGATRADRRRRAGGVGRGRRLRPRPGARRGPCPPRATPPGACRRARGARLHARGRPRLAPDVLQRAHRGE